MAANQAQLLMLLNQVNNLETQMKVAQSQTMDINQVPMAANPMMGVNANLLTMLSQMQSKSTKPSKFEKSGAKPTRKGSNANIASLLAALTGSSTGQEERGRCIWVTSLPESYQDSTKLINIFGNFGNVRKVVFTDKKPDGALIELDDARGSVKAVANMRGQKLDGQPIKVSFTKIDQAGMKNDDKSKDVRQAKENWRFSGNKDSKFRGNLHGKVEAIKQLCHCVKPTRGQV
jgi:RNA recognition motif-containing protein